MAYKGTSQAQSADATVDLIQAPAVLTDRNQRFKLTVSIMPSESEAAAALNPGDEDVPKAKRTVVYEILQAEPIRDGAGGDVVTSCRVVLARAKKGS